MVKFVDKKALAELIGTTPRNIENLMSQGMPHHKIGSLVRFRLDYVLPWIDQKFMQGEPPSPAVVGVESQDHAATDGEPAPARSQEATEGTNERIRSVLDAHERHKAASSAGQE